MLSLAGNQINTVDQLQEISCLSNLASLDLYGCPVTETTDYSIKAFEMFKNLQVLDAMDKNGEEVSVASEYDDDDDDSEEAEDDQEEDSLSDFIEKDEPEQLKRKRDSEENNDPECKKLPDT